MNKKQALVVQILAQKSVRDKAVNRITAPDNLYEEVRKQYEKTESDMKDVKVTVSVRGDRNAQKAVTWQPSHGLCVHDTGPSGFPHWSSLPDGVLLTAISLLPKLLDQANQIRTKNKSKDLEEGAKAVLNGSKLPLVPPPTPIARPVDERDSPVEKTILEDDYEEDEIYEDEEEEDEEEMEEEEEDSSDGAEILGSGRLPDLDNEPQVNLEELLPPAAVIQDSEPKKPRRSRKK